MSTHARRQELLGWLRDNRSATAEQASVAFGVSLRTLHRDLAALRYSGVPIEGEPGRGGGIRVDPMATIPGVHFTADEAVGLYLSLNLASQMGVPTAGAKSILKKVAAVLTEERVKELDAFLKRILVKKGGGTLNDDALLAYLEEAFSSNHGLRFDYGKGKVQTIHVQGLAAVGGKVLVLGCDAKSLTPKTYNASKISKPRILKSIDATAVAMSQFKKVT